MDITSIIQDDHAEQRALFAMIEDIDSNETVALAAVWKRLSILLEVHAEAEERHFYPHLLKVGRGANDADDAKEETLDAIEDHNEIRDAVREVDRHETGSGSWRDAVDAANKANSDHMAEEERQGLADFRKHASSKARHDLAVKFVTYKFRHLDGIPAKDKDPEVYVETHQ